MYRLRVIAALLAAIVTVAALLAHDPGLSSVHVDRTAAGIEARLTFAWTDLWPILGGDRGSARPTGPELAIAEANLARDRAAFATIEDGGVVRAPAAVRLVPSSASANEVAVTLLWPRVTSTQIRIDFGVLAKLAFGHRMILSVGKSAEAVALLDGRHPTWELQAETAAGSNPTGGTSQPAPSWTSFVLLGVEHILTGFDHLCFLFALLLVALRLREVLAVVTTFTIAHSLTLAAAATGLASLSTKIVEPLIAASIVYIGVENLWLRRPPRHRIALVFGFGLVHGLGFASALAERLPGVTGFAMVPPLLSFNAGVELGQLAVASCLIPLIRIGRSYPAFVPRWQPAFSAAIAIAGAVWFCQRV